MTRRSEPQGSARSTELDELPSILAEQAPVMLWISRARDRRDWFNRSWLEFAGRRLEDELGTAWTERVHPDDLDSHRATWSESFDARRGYTAQVRLRRHDGRYRALLETAAPFLDRGAGFGGLIGACLDVTEREEAEAAERAARAEAEKQLHQREALISTLAHDLRSPLSAMLGWAHLLRSDPTHEPKELEHGLEVFERNARIQSRLVAEIADANRLASGKSHLARRPVPLQGVVSAAVQVVTGKAKDRGVRILERPGPDGIVVDADPERLGKVIASLIDHTMELAPAGAAVEVRTERAAEGVEIRIARDGAVGGGLPPPGDKWLCGSELGRLLVQSVVELHGGTLRMPQDGEGFAFIVSLPLSHSGAEPLG